MGSVKLAVVAGTLVALFSSGVAEVVQIRKADFPRFLGVVACGAEAGEECPGAADGFAAHGLAGEPGSPDPAAAEHTAGGKVVLGFLEGKPFTWPRYSVEFPGSCRKWVVLNEVSGNDRNRVFLTLWRHTGSTLDLVKIFPRFLPLVLGETTVHSQASLPDGSLLLVLKGEGTDAGVRLQDFRLLRLHADGRMEEVHRRTNRSEIPVQEILDRLNAYQPVEPVLDSTLSCEVGRRKGASGGPLVRFTVARSRVLYTKAGPQETPEGRTSEEVDIWKLLKGRQGASRRP